MGRHRVVVLPSEISAAVLLAQLEAIDVITTGRLGYGSVTTKHSRSWERKGIVRRPVVPEDCSHNGHLYYLLFPDAFCRSAVQSFLREQDVNAVFHYVPLHSSPGRPHVRTDSRTVAGDGPDRRSAAAPAAVGGDGR